MMVKIISVQFFQINIATYHQMLEEPIHSSLLNQTVKHPERGSDRVKTWRLLSKIAPFSQ